MGKTSKALGKSGYSLDVQVQPSVGTINGGLVGSVVNTIKGASHDESISVGELHHPPVLPNQWDERLAKVANLSSKTAESFRVLRSKILLPQDGSPAPKTIMVTSALPQEGKSFVSANLGIALAQGVDQNSLLVDCDLRVPSLAKLFGLPFKKGLVDYLQGGGELASFLKKTSMAKLSVLASGLPPANPAELLGSERMQSLVAELAGRYPDRYVIFDTPPFEVASETKVLSQAVDGVVLVVRYGVSDRTMIEKIISEIGKDRIIGIIFNAQRSNFISNRLVYKKQYYDGYYLGK